ncbi:Pyroglutamyl-peptidase 1-like protein, partial [Kappamyces sp. JEL0680]
PFANVSLNPSWEAVKKLPSVLGTMDCTTKNMSVEYEFVQSHLPRWIHDLQPHLVVCVGVARGTTALRLEKIGRNGVYSSPDISNQLPAHGVCHSDDAPETLYQSSLDLESVCQDLAAAGYDAVVSSNAGTFLCDFALATSLKMLDRSVFLHIPEVSSEWTQECLDRAVFNAITILCNIA